MTIPLRPATGRALSQYGMGFCEVAGEREYLPDPARPGRTDNGFLSDLYLFVASSRRMQERRGAARPLPLHITLFGHFAGGAAALHGGNYQGVGERTRRIRRTTENFVATAV